MNNAKSGNASATVGASGGSSKMVGFLDRLASFRGVILFWLVYGLAHGFLRLALSSTLSLDDARANELVQNLALGYQVRQPPLYEWLLWSSQQLLGPGIASHLLVRYLLIAGIGLVAYSATRTATGDRRWSAVASLSLAFTYPIGWTFHEWATQTMIGAIACFLTLQAVTHFVMRPDWRAVFYLGLAMGLGLMSKFNYLLFLGGIALAVLSLPEARRRFADPRLVVVPLIALAMASPYLFWLTQVHGDVVGMASEHLIQESEPLWRRSLDGLAKLAWALPAFLMPWLLIVVAGAWPAFVPSREPRPAPGIGERLALRAMIFAALIAAIGTAAIGATNIGERYMHPILIVAPVYVFARIARLAPEEARVRGFVLIAVVAALVIFAIRIVSFTENRVTETITRPFVLPFAALADEFRKAGITDGTVIGATVREAGNLRAFLPDLRITAGDSFRIERAPRRPSDDRSCVIVWGPGDRNKARRLAPVGDVDAVKVEVEEPAFLGGVRHGTWWYARLDPSLQACS